MFRLLIVDDSNIIRRKVERSVLGEHFKVIGMAANGIEAIAKLKKKQHPDVITMDLTMPGMDGIECIGKIMEINSSIRILVISALADVETGILALEKGARGFLRKPFSEQQLVEALTELMEAARV